MYLLCRKAHGCNAGELSILLLSERNLSGTIHTEFYEVLEGIHGHFISS